MTKRTYQPKQKKRIRAYGFLTRMMTEAGRKLIKKRKLKGRKRVCLTK
jgi:large subunit ribosomal protein L34